MIPIQGTAAVLTAPSSPLQTSGYVPGNTLAAQTFNWYLYHMTAEINNVLSGQNLSQSTADDSQLLKAVGRTNILISTSGTVTTATQFAGNTLTQFANLTGSSNYVITAGAARPGIELIVEALTGSGVMIVNGSGSAFLGSGAVRLLWDGSQWCKIGGNVFTQIFTSGSAVSWITPWKGVYKSAVTGSGGAGAGFTSLSGSYGGSGSGAGTSMKWLAENAGVSLVCTVGATVNGTASGSGSDGNDSVLSDGLSTLTGGKGLGGVSAAAGVGGKAGGVASGGHINIAGGASMCNIAATGTSGNSGASYYGGSVLGASSANGNSGSAPGSGGSGAASSGGPNTFTGGNGGPGLIVIEF